MSLNDALQDMIRAGRVATDRAEHDGLLAVSAELADHTERLEKLLEDTTPPRTPYRGAFTKENHGPRRDYRGEP